MDAKQAPAVYAPCSNCASRLIEIDYQIESPTADFDINDLARLFRDFYLHCPGNTYKEFATFMSSKIKKLLESRIRKRIHCQGSRSSNRSILEQHGQLAELAEFAEKTNSREGLTFLMWQAKDVGRGSSDMNFYQNYEAIVNSRVGELTKDSKPDSLKSIVKSLEIHRVRRAEDWAKITELQKTNKTDELQEQVRKLEKVAEQRLQLSNIYQKALEELRPQNEALLVEHKANEAGLLELAAYIEEQNKIIAKQKLIIDQVQGVISDQ
jgi:hypothetical protein